MTAILVTGATGSFGSAFLRSLCADQTYDRIVAFSRDELKQHQLRQEITESRVRWFLGDVRDLERLTLAFRGVDVVVHAAALKQVPAGEYNPSEFIRTNVLGSMNVALAALGTSVQKCLMLSTDKAVNPANLYGATKMCAEKFWLAANNYAGAHGPKFSVVRYGNVAGSRGSVIPLFREKLARGEPLPITDPQMTRFWITLPQAAAFVREKLAVMQGRELFVPKMPSVRVGDIADVLLGDCPSPSATPGLYFRWRDQHITNVGMRPGEKLHETVVSEWEHIDGLPSPYCSETNDWWLEGEDLRKALEAV